MQKSPLLSFLFILAISININAQSTVRFTGTELLGRPTDSSITLNIIASSPIDAYVEYGTESGVYSGSTETVSKPADVPVEMTLSGLKANTKYFYRLMYSSDGGETWQERDEHTFHTQRPPGSTFTFTIIADSHLGQYGGLTFRERNLYRQTLLNISPDQPDFHIDLGDTFPMDPDPLGTGMTEDEGRAAYMIQRPFMGLIGHSVPIYLVLGNHENEEGWNFDDQFDPPDQSLARISVKYRKLFYPNPVPDGFYTGNSDPLDEPIAGDTFREDYYAWGWGDALFIVLDPFHYTMIWPGPRYGYGSEGEDNEPVGDRWDWTLGIEQYLWFKNTLEQSNATYKFVFSHHITGGATAYGRGGESAVPYFEWGGKNWNGTWGFDKERPASDGWSLPVHQMMVENGVTAFFHGHDHIYAREEVDGILYLECPKPDDAGYDWEPYGYGYTENLYPKAVQIPNSGHIRVKVSPNNVVVDYVRSYLTGEGNNREIADTYVTESVKDVTGSTSANLVWQTSKETSVSMAKAQGKHILLLGGREICPNCQYMRYTVCESASPPIKDLIEQSFIPWYCDVDNSTEWHNYGSGLGSFTLPLICVIDPNDSNNYLDRTTGIQDIQEFYARLLQYSEVDADSDGTPDTGEIAYGDGGGGGGGGCFIATAERDRKEIKGSTGKYGPVGGFNNCIHIN